MSRLAATLFFIATIALACSPNVAQESAKVAVVNDQPISLAVVNYTLDRSLRMEPSTSQWEKRSFGILKAGLEHCINREVILQHLQSGKSVITESQAGRLLDEAKARIEIGSETLESFLKTVGLTQQEYTRELVWNRAWRKYAMTHVTEKHLEDQFQKRKRTLDGTEVHVAQILWKSTDAETINKASEVYRQLVAKEIEWKAAVKEHSESASAQNGGDLGWVKFTGPMPREFSTVAFALKPGEFAKPFTSKFGTHLIHCIEEKPGAKTFGDVAVELREFETKRLFQLVSQRHRPKAKIEIFTTPHGNESTDSKK